jgi:hypothetical protein
MSESRSDRPERLLIKSESAGKAETAKEIRQRTEKAPGIAEGEIGNETRFDRETRV